MKNFPNSLRKSITRLTYVLLLPLIASIILILIKPQISQAANGARMGGGNFNTPSVPRGGGGFNQNYGGGYYRGGGIGFPFIFPFFGFGGAGLFGLLILIAITGTITNALKRGISPSISDRSLERTTSSPVTVRMIQLQIGFLASAKELQKDLRNLAISSETKTSIGLQKVLQETSLALLRQPNHWVYANLETGKVPFHAAETTFNRLSISERSKLKSEVISNISGTTLEAFDPMIESNEPKKIKEFIAVTVLIASTSELQLSTTITNELLQKNLSLIGSIPSKELIALEVIWQPEGENEALSSEELLTNYPNLKYL